MTRPRPRLKGSESQSRDRDRDHKNIETKTKVVETIKDETSKFGSRLISENLSRPRLIETEQFCRCRDRDSSRLGNFVDVETETDRDWAKDVENKTLSRVLLISEIDLAQLDNCVMKKHANSDKVLLICVNILTHIGRFLSPECPD